MSTKYATRSQVEFAIQARLASISQLNDEIITLKGEANAFSPVSRLPVEIMGEIFLQALPSLERIEQSPRDWPRPWFTLTQVCRSWRKVATGYRRLWTIIVFRDSTEVIDIFSERSGQSSLAVIRQQECQVPLSYTASFLLSHAHRIRVLQGFTISSELAMALMESTTRCISFAAIETLVLGFTAGAESPVSISSLSSILRTLHCDNAPQSFIDVIPRHSLTTLDISYPRTPHDPLTWLNFLRDFETLENLYLWGVFSSESPAPSSRQIIARFPHLRHLSLDDPSHGKAALSFIEQCDIPRTTSVLVKSMAVGILEDFQSTFRWLSSIASGDEENTALEQPLLSCHMSCDDHSWFVRLWANYIPSEDLQNNDGPNWEISFNPDACEILTYAFFTSFTLPKLCSLCLGCIQARVDVLNPLLRNRTIREIYIDRQDTMWSLLAQYCYLWARGEEGLSSLQLLQFNYIPWVRHNDSAKRLQKDPLVVLLEDMLRMRIRATRGVRLKRLKIGHASCYGGYDRAILEQFVETVELRGEKGSEWECPTCVGEEVREDIATEDSDSDID